jgi:diguanylate cyclase (GGDEF)-like protein
VTVLTHSGLLLEHFARLATNVAGTSSATIGVLGRRKELEVTRAGYGLTREQLNAVQGIEGILESGPDLTVVPDLAQDGRFGGEQGAFAESGLHFLAYMKLISPGGDQVGFICLIDGEARSGLSDAQNASLGQIASMIMADRQREQRHLHLMHVADRALRVDRMLRLVSEAESCADALTNLLEALCHFHGAAVGQIWQLVAPEKPLVEISRYHHDHEVGSAFQTIGPLVTLDEMTAEAIRRNKPHAIRFPALKPLGSDAGTTSFTGHVCIPIWAQQQRFGISLAFTTENVDLDSVAGDIASLGDTIRPALFQKVTEERIRFAAHHDDLTQLSNRLMFQDRLRKALAASRSAGQAFALLCLDLDGFKLVNDIHGHGFGDSLLVGIAQRLREHVRESDTVARMGGDEFSIILRIDNNFDEAVDLAKRLIESIAQPFELAGRQALVGVSIGIALSTEHGESPDQLMRNADHALYRAKKSGRKTYCVFDPAMEDNMQEPFLVEQDLKDAISRGDFSLAYQPVCDTRSLHVVGFEALLRWRHPLLGPIAPDLFIPLAEKSGLIVPLGRWVLETACADAAKWARPANINVNLSPLQFRQPDLPQQVAEVLRRTGLPASRLRLEVTEGLLLDESKLVMKTMGALQDQGIQIILDDFGTAYANMNYLRRFPFNGLKIDKSFIRGLYNDEITLAIVQAILSLAERLNLSVVAEGVETERELNVLRKLNCRYIQGYLTGRPADNQAANAQLRQSWAGDAEVDMIDIKDLARPARTGNLVAAWEPTDTRR